MGERTLSVRRVASAVRAGLHARCGAAVRSAFLRDVAETIVTRVALVAVGLVTSVLIARSLGPEGRGLQATVAAITALGVQLGNLGLHASNVYYVSRDRSLLPVLVGNSLVVSLLGGSLLCMAAYAATLVIPGLSPLHTVLLVLALGSVPVSLSYLLLQNLLLGIGKVRSYNAIEIVTRLVMVGVLGMLINARRVSVESVAAAGLLISVVSAAWAAAVLWPCLGRRVTLSFEMLRAQLGYGVRAYLAALFSYAVLRADILMCKYMLGAPLTGQYSIAVSMADMVYMLPMVAGTMAFPRLAATEDAAERWQKAKRAARWVGLLLIGLATIAAALARPVVELFFGSVFLPSVEAFVWLLPGIVMLGTNTIFMNYFAAEGFPGIAVWSPAAACVLNILLNLALIPRDGIVGASISSTCAYSMMLGLSLWYMRFEGVRR